MSNILITGSNRGIGLALARAYLERGARVFATCRYPDRATALLELAASAGERLTIIALDVREAASIQAAGAIVREHTDSVDVLINNAAINPPSEDQTLAYIDFTTMADVFRTNAFAPLMMVQHFLPLLRRSSGAKVVNISSEMGSIGQTHGSEDYAYSASKAALNMISRLLANEFVPYGIIVVPLDPGWVRTDMSPSHAPLSAEESAAGIVRVIERLTRADSGKFWVYDGTQHAW
jgi:NAD(P)-dependent dehydrogenase (short-subunit alcohol dehydrogenase family)